MPNPIPAGHHTITPYIICENAEAAIDFYKKAFGAQEVARMKGPDGKKIMHAEIKIGNSHLMLADEFPEMKARSPKAFDGHYSSLMLYFDNVDVAWDVAVKAGATVIMPLSLMFWGDRYGKLQDPFGHQWSLAQHIEDLTPAEIEKRQKEFFAQAAGSRK